MLEDHFERYDIKRSWRSYLSEEAFFQLLQYTKSRKMHNKLIDTGLNLSANSDLIQYRLSQETKHQPI